MASTSYVEVQVDSKARMGGTPDNFTVSIENLSFLEASAYHVTLQQGILGNQPYNITEHNNTFYGTYDPTTLTDLNPTNKYVIPQGLYTGVSLATAIQTALNSRLDSSWSLTWAVTFDATLQSFQFVMNSPVITTYFYFDSISSTRTQLFSTAKDYIVYAEPLVGNPLHAPSFEFYLLAGLLGYWAGNPAGSNFMKQTVTSTFHGTSINLSGNAYVDVLCNVTSVPTMHTDKRIRAMMQRVALGDLDAQTVFTRGTIDQPIDPIPRNQLKALSFEILNEWGLPFTLPDNITVAFTLRCYPIAL